jgi:hypothetical protein
MGITRCTGRLLVAAIAVGLSVYYSMVAIQESMETGPHNLAAEFLEAILFPAGCAITAIVLLAAVFVSRNATPLQKQIGIALLILLTWGWSMYCWWGVRS